MAKEAKDVKPLFFSWIRGYKVVDGQKIAITKEEAAKLDEKARQHEWPRNSQRGAVETTQGMLFYIHRTSDGLEWNNDGDIIKPGKMQKFTTLMELQNWMLHTPGCTSIVLHLNHWAFGQCIEIYDDYRE